MGICEVGQVKAPQIAPNLSTTLTTWRRSAYVSVSSWQQKHNGSPVCWFMIGHGNGKSSAVENGPVPSMIYRKSRKLKRIARGYP